jgi:biopolymer transport protein ExbD
MKIRNTGRHQEGVELMMTPMVDIVFQLLIFFLMTFKIASAEGDFNVKMPLAAPSEGKPDDLQLPPLKVRLTAEPGGRIAGIFLGQTPMKDFRQLRREIVGIVGDDTGPGSVADTQEVELDCDYRLDFRYVIDAITAVSGEVTPDGEVVKLIEKIKFAPPRGD